MLKLVLHHQDLNLPRSNIVNVYRRIINLGIFLFVYNIEAWILMMHYQVGQKMLIFTSETTNLSKNKC